MSNNYFLSASISAVIFDMGGTLRTREPHEPTQQAAIARMIALLGIEKATDTYWAELQRRYRAYAVWAQEHLIESSEAEIWTRWMVPELPRERIEPAAKELTLLWRRRVGIATPKPDAEQTIAELYRRHYRLGLISNTISSIDVPLSLEAYGWRKYFEVVLLSSTSKRRKPDPYLFWEATTAMHIDPACCAYVGDLTSRDVVGSHKAGFGMAILIKNPGPVREEEKSQTEQPEATIHELSELLEIFPPRK
jgi:FMN phosphatase YigB (HAD superfamily)